MVENVYRINVYKSRTNTTNYDGLKTYMVTGESMSAIRGMLADLYKDKGKQYDIYKVDHPGKLGGKT